jgi:hypothetical protein
LYFIEEEKPREDAGRTAPGRWVPDPVTCEGILRAISGGRRTEKRILVSIRQDLADPGSLSQYIDYFSRLGYVADSSAESPEEGKSGYYITQGGKQALGRASDVIGRAVEIFPRGKRRDGRFRPNRH